jgi:hypothetical protein
MMRPLVRRFVAGDDLSDAMEAVRRLNDAGMTATLDYLGEAVTNADEASRAALQYIATLHAIERQGVRGYLQDSDLQPGFGELAQEGLDADRFGRGQVVIIRALLVTDLEVHGGQPAGPPPGRLEDRREQPGGARLTVGPGHADQREPARGVPVERGREVRHGRPSGGKLDPREGAVRDGSFTGDRRGSVRGRLRHEPTAVTLEAWYGHE